MAESQVKMGNHEVQRAYREQWQSQTRPTTLAYLDLRPHQHGQATVVDTYPAGAMTKGGRQRSKAKFAIEDYLDSV